VRPSSKIPRFAPGRQRERTRVAALPTSGIHEPVCAVPIALWLGMTLPPHS